MVLVDAASASSAASPARSLLLVEDDLELAALLRDALQETIPKVACADTARLARQRLASQAWDVVVLDAQLPDGDGFELCRELRQTPSAAAVLMLTARASEADRVTGLELGADDYLTKPFSLRELLLRVGNLLRRRASGPGAAAVDRIACGDLVIEVGHRRVHCRGREIVLTPREFDLLAFMARKADHVFTRSQLLSAVWGARFEGFEHTVNSHINRLRAKIESDPRRPGRLVTVWGAGYRLVGSPVDSALAR